MKKFKLFKLLALFVVLITSINAWGQTYKPARVDERKAMPVVTMQGAGMQSQQMMSGGAYNGTVYEPFSNTTPSEANNPARVSGPRKSGPADRNPGDATEATTESPIGEPWIMALFALVFAGIIMIKKKNRNIEKSTEMKHSTKFIATLALFLTLGVGNVWSEQYCDFWDDNHSVMFTVNGSDQNKTITKNGVSDINLGTVRSLTLKQFISRTWRYDAGNVCQVKMYYNISTTKNSWGGETITVGSSMDNDHYGQWRDGSTGKTNAQWAHYNIGTDLLSGLTPGTTYYIDFNFAINGDKSAGGGCWDGQANLNNNGGNYHVQFTVARDYDVYFRTTRDVNWPQVYVYQWNASENSGYTAATLHNNGGTGKWYKVTLNTSYTNFMLTENTSPSGDAGCGGHKTVNLTSSTDMEDKCYWLICKYNVDLKKSASDIDYKFTGHSNLTAPTVELNYAEPSKTIMALTGHVTNFGYDINYVNNGWECGFTLIDSKGVEQEYTACHYVDDASGYFSKTVTGLKEGETYTVKVWAKNGYAKGTTAGESKTMKSAGNARVWVYNEAGDATVYLHAWYTNKCTGNVSEVTFPGYVMNHLEGTDWWWFDVPNDYPRFILSDGTNGNKTPEGQDKGTTDYAYFTNRDHKLAEYTGGHPTAYYIESKVGERRYYSNVVTNTTDTMSFYASSTGTIKLVKADGTKTGDLTSSLTFGGASGGVFTAKTNGSALVEPAAYEGTYHIHVNADTQNHLDAGGVPTPGDAIGDKFTEFRTSTVFGDLYNYYWVDWFPSGTAHSVIASVGNEYNDDLAGVLGADAYAPSGTTTTSGANVRYGYNPETNYFVRAMIAGSGTEVKVKALADNTITVGGNDAYDEAQSFTDAANWVYTVNATIKGQSHAAVVSSYNGYQQPLEADQQLMGGNTDQDYTVMISYDFKTDRLIAAWAPDGSEIKPSFDLLSNIMIERVEDGNPAILNLADAVEIRKISQIYTVMTFNSSTWNASSRTISTPPYTDAYYWFSLPYDCYISDVFGMSGYGDKWVVQTYRGDLRAKSAWWAEIDSWWYNMDQNEMMKANEGYVLRMTNLYFGGASALRLYFPSAQSDITIGELGASTTTSLDTLICHVWRKKEGVENLGEGNPIYDRRAIDSNWRILGSPSFNSTNISGTPVFLDPSHVVTDAEKKDSCALRYLYTWTVSAGKPVYTITSTAGFTFPGTHAYLVQYAGTITWTPATSNPLVGVKAPARNQEISLDKDFRLILKQNGEQADVAYVSLLENGATEDYDMNLDLSKVMNSKRANLYTIAGYYQMAGNCLPISDSTTVVPVGVKLTQDGEYTFSMPEGTYGIGAVLVDKVANTRTNLALTDYAVTLTAGTYDERFELELSPIAQAPTDIETISDDRLEISGVRKVMVDGVLYIVKDGKVFDARGNRVQ